MLVQLRKLNKRMKKLEKRFGEAEGQPVKQARLLRMALSTQKRIDKIVNILDEMEEARNGPKIQIADAGSGEGRGLIV